MIVKAPTFADIVFEDIEKTLAEYRQLVGRAASGWKLTGDEKKTAHKALRILDLPEWCLRRDVVAVRKWWQSPTDYQRREMLVVYPHLFCEPRQWAQWRQTDQERRRKTISKIAAAR